MTATQARSLDRKHPLPLWAQLQQDLVRRLELGAFDDGFPGEHELAGAYDVSRHTVREALRRLRESGVLDSARGRPTQVRGGIEQPLGSLYSLFREVEARGMVQVSEVLAQRSVRDPGVAAVLGLPARAALFSLERVRMADGEPLAHDRAWLPLELAEPLLDTDFRHGALYDALAARCGVRMTGGHERITAVLPDEGERSLLALPAGHACLSVERQGYAGSQLVEHRVTLVRGDRWSVVADWSTRGPSVGALTQGAVPRPAAAPS